MGTHSRSDKLSTDAVDGAAVNEPKSPPPTQHRIEIVRLHKLFYSYEEAGRVLGLSAGSIGRLCLCGELQRVYIPGRRSPCVPLPSIIDFANRIPGAPQCSYPEIGRLGRIFCSLTEVAAILSTSDNGIRYLVKTGQLSPVRLSKKRLHIPYQSVHDFAARQAAPGVSRD